VCVVQVIHQRDAHRQTEISQYCSIEAMSREDEHGFEDDDQLPLQNTWCLWHDKFTGNASAEQYAASLKKLCSFSTVQVELHTRESER